MDHPKISIHSSCNTTISIEHAPKSFFELMVSELRSSSLGSYERQIDFIRSIILLWIVREDGQIFLTPRDLESTTIHVCETCTWYNFDDALHKLSLLVYHGLYSKEPQSCQSKHKFRSKWPIDDIPFIQIKFSCTPSFIVQKDNRYFDCCQFCASICKESEAQPNTNDLINALNTWMIHVNGQILVTNAVDSSASFPPSIGPLFQAISHTMLYDIVGADSEERIIQNIEDKTQEQETQPCLEPIPKKPIRKGQQRQHISQPLSSKISPMKTRRQCALMASMLIQQSKSKNPIMYNNPNNKKQRHMPGTDPKTKRPQVMRRPLPRKPMQCVVASRLQLFQDLEVLHNKMKNANVRAPRDDWEQWIDGHLSNDHDSDRAFMCLLVILMSSSTTDRQLADVVPRLFMLGLTSAKATIEIAKRYGMDAFTSIISGSGRYYDNAERIVNAADYFIKYHHGRIPPTISLNELQCIHGIGHKTASIVLTFAFNRHEGIPSDVHVMRCCKVLNWIPVSVTDGLESSMILQSWMPQQYWHIVNPLFGAFGQLLSTKEDSQQSFAIVYCHTFPGERSLDDPYQIRMNYLQYAYSQLINEYKTWT